MEDNGDVKKVKTILVGLCDDIISRQEEFCSLDAKAGDGDLGITLTYGCRAIKKYIAGLDSADITIAELLFKSGEQFEENTGSTFSIIASEMFYSAAKLLEGVDEPGTTETAAAFVQMAEGVKNRGKVNIGDKTIYDALKPSSDIFHAAAIRGDSLKSCFKQALDVASEAAENTRGLKAKIGRASWMGEKVVEELDAGAVVWVRVLEFITGQLS